MGKYPSGRKILENRSLGGVLLKVQEREREPNATDSDLGLTVESLSNALARARSSVFLVRLPKNSDFKRKERDRRPDKATEEKIGRELDPRRLSLIVAALERPTLAHLGQAISLPTLHFMYLLISKFDYFFMYTIHYIHQTMSS